jgi:hypothetical protein
LTGDQPGTELDILYCTGDSAPCAKPATTITENEMGWCWFTCDDHTELLHCQVAGSIWVNPIVHDFVRNAITE